MLPPARGSPTLVQALPGPSVQVTAGSNHTAVLLMDGQVFTFGSFSVSGFSLWRLHFFKCSLFDTCFDILDIYCSSEWIYLYLYIYMYSLSCRKDSWAGLSWTCPTGMPSRPPCPTSGPNMGGRPPGLVLAGTRRSCGLMRLLSTPMSSPLQRSLPANTSSALCPPLHLSRLLLNACWSTKWTEAAGPSTTLSRKTCRDLACVWTLCMMSYGG